MLLGFFVANYIILFEGRAYYYMYHLLMSIIFYHNITCVEKM